MNHESSDSQDPYVSPIIPKESERPSFPPSTNKPTELQVHPILVSGALSVDDVGNAMKLANSGSRRFMWIIVIAVIGVYGLWTVIQVIRGVYEPKDISGIAVLLITSFFCFCAVWWNFWRKMKKACAGGKGQFAATDYLISEEGFETRSESAADKVGWEFFSRYRFSDHFVLLFFREIPMMYLIFPRRMFRTPEDWEYFLGLVDRKLPRC